jgi:hypothetical protein
VALLRKAIQSFRLRLHSSLRQSGTHSSRERRDEWGPDLWLDLMYGPPAEPCASGEDAEGDVRVGFLRIFAVAKMTRLSDNIRTPWARYPPVRARLCHMARRDAELRWCEGSSVESTSFITVERFSL